MRKSANASHRHCPGARFAPAQTFSAGEELHTASLADPGLTMERGTITVADRTFFTFTEDYGLTMPAGPDSVQLRATEAWTR